MHIRDQEINFVVNSSLIIEDPAIDQFSLFIDFNAHYGLFADESYVNSALGYLKRTGETECYENLKLAIRHFKIIQERLQYRLVSIDGIDELFTQRNQRGHVVPLALTFRENVEWDLRHAMMSLMKCMYDDHRQIYVLPENLCRFSCIIFFSDMRTLKSHEQGTNYKERYGSDITSLKNQTESAYDLGRFKEQPIEQGDYFVSDGQHIAITMPVCEMVIPNLGLSANHLDMQPKDHQIIINVKRYNWSALFMNKATISNVPELNPLGDPKGYTEKLKQMFKNKLQIFLLSKVQELRDRVVSSALDLYENIMASTGVTELLGGYVKPNDFWQGIDNGRFKQSYEQYAKKLDESRTAELNKLTGGSNYADNLS